MGGINSTLESQLTKVEFEKHRPRRAAIALAAAALLGSEPIAPFWPDLSRIAGNISNLLTPDVECNSPG